MKNLPKEVRGAMTVLLTFFLSLGSLLYNGVGGPIFDGLGPNSPFKLVSIMDMATCLFALLLGCSGRLAQSQQAPQETLKQPEHCPDEKEHLLSEQDTQDKSLYATASEDNAKDNHH